MIFQATTKATTGLVGLLIIVLIGHGIVAGAPSTEALYLTETTTNKFSKYAVANVHCPAGFVNAAVLCRGPINWPISQTYAESQTMTCVWIVPPSDEGKQVSLVVRGTCLGPA